MIHSLSDCQNNNIPASTNIWQFCVVLPNCKIGECCNICFLPTVVKNGASIGAGSTILPGLTIGENAFVGAGSMVTKDVPAGELWMGNPAKFVRKIEK